jgi:hypothetical protein
LTWKSVIKEMTSSSGADFWSFVNDVCGLQWGVSGSGENERERESREIGQDRMAGKFVDVTQDT